jgi:hypothetical protein
VVFERFRVPAGATAPCEIAGRSVDATVLRFDGRRARRRLPLSAAMGWVAGLAACAAVVVSIQVWRAAGPQAGDAAMAATDASDGPTAVAEVTPTPPAPRPVFAAPLVPAVRPDPYVIQFPDPFGLALRGPDWAYQAGLGQELFVPAAFSVPAGLEPGLELPTSLDFYQPVNAWPAGPTPPVFRSRAAGEGAALQPVGFEIRR